MTANGTTINMPEMTLDDDFRTVEKGQAQGMKIMEKIFSGAQPNAIFSQPIVSGNYTLITACEISSGGGFGFGRGFGPGTEAQKGTEKAEFNGQQFAGGGGMGGGGGSLGRPIAVIVVGPEGVTVRPVVDATKVALAAITAWGAIFLAVRKMSRGRK
ncbi:MAG TPA: hypothetical protein VH186_17000 [Chloroflexia bacterium]|nr:hypothetical protein [Chloroflexia bacterium]